MAFKNFLPDNINESIVLNPTDVTEVQEIGRSLKSGNSMGYDNICALILKNSIDVISSPLVEIINLSLSQSVFSDKLKITKLIPVFKAGESKYFTNYRPISLLSNFSNIFERVMHNRVLEFGNRMEILYSHQFGFRKGFSTALSLIHLVNSVASAVDRNEFTVGVFLDLSKAFDTLDHRILLTKLEHDNIRGLALEWIKSYLSNRSQYVLFNGIRSDPCFIKCGVPQGSILGPLLFVLYINDLPMATKSTESMLFADDTSIFYSSPDLETATNIVANEQADVDLYMKANKLSVNIDKTNFVIFSSRQKSLSQPMPPILYNGVSLKQKKAVKFLGVYVDQHLTWKDHISYTSKKIAKVLASCTDHAFFISHDEDRFIL